MLGVLLLVAVFAIAGLTPSTAAAFTGESVVLNPGKTDLTTPAKTIISKPTFLPANVGEAAIMGTAEEATAAAGVYETAGLIPIIGGSIAAFSAGALVGSEICGLLGIEGCWFVGNKTPDPKYPASGKWVFHQNGTSGTFYDTSSPWKTAPFSYAWAWSGSTVADFSWNETGIGCFVPATPTGASVFLKSPTANDYCAFSVEKKLGKTHTSIAVRYGMENRVFEYHPTDDPSIPNASFTPSSKWSENLATQIKGQTGNPAGRVGQKIASEIEGSKVANPYVVKVPSCEGMTPAACVGLLEELELKPDVQELDWDDAVIEELDELEPEKTREEEAERIIELAPAAPSEVKIGTEVDVVTNPKEDDMPKWVPLPPPDGEDEDAEEYKKRRRLIPPLWLPSVDELDDGQLDPDKGPGAVVNTTPRPNFDSDPGGEPDGRLDPHTETDIKIWTNPENATEPGSYGTGVPGGFTPPTIPAIDMDPLGGLSPCGVFPFGLFCWVGEAFAQFNTTGTCPHFSTPVADTGSNFAVTLCGETAETIMGYLRPAILLAFTVGLGFLFARGTKAIGGD